VLSQCILISFHRSPLEAARAHGGLPVGWVLPAWNAERRAQAAELQPDYLFCNRKRLPPASEPLWPGPWQWAGYTINDANEALAFGERGFSLLETDCIGRLLGDARLARARHG
jgi:glycerophosphoryl diester phosphodiesterase